MFTDENRMSVKEKTEVLHDWQRFIRNGFQDEDFSDALYAHLIQHASFIAHFDRQTFWQVYFAGEFGYFARFINQFGGDLRSAELAFNDWMESRTGSDLNGALIGEMRLFFTRFIAVLESSAIAAYDTEKWSALTRLNPRADSQTLKTLASIYEELYPLDDLAQYQIVTAEVREKLRLAIESTIADDTVSTFFEARTPRAPSAQATLFERKEARPVDASRLAGDIEHETRAFDMPKEDDDEYLS